MGEEYGCGRLLESTTLSRFGPLPSLPMELFRLCTCLDQLYSFSTLTYRTRWIPPGEEIGTCKPPVRTQGSMAVETENEQIPNAKI